MEADDFTGRPVARVMKDVAEAATKAAEDAAQQAARPLREMADTVDLRRTSIVSGDADGVPLVDGQTLDLGRIPEADGAERAEHWEPEGDGAEGVEYWEPDAQGWGESEAQRFDTTEMGSGHIGEHLPTGSEPGVTYLYSEADRRPFRLEVRDDGLIYDANGDPFDTTAAEVFDRLDRRRPRRALFVMDSDGNLYASLFGGRPHRFQHSSFLAGAPVAGAGEIEVVQGRLRLLNDVSGHYMPERRYAMQVVQRLRELGVRIGPEQLNITAPE